MSEGEERTEKFGHETDKDDDFDHLIVGAMPKPSNTRKGVGDNKLMAVGEKALKRESWKQFFTDRKRALRKSLQTSADQTLL